MTDERAREIIGEITRLMQEMLNTGVDNLETPAEAVAVMSEIEAGATVVLASKATPELCAVAISIIRGTGLQKLFEIQGTAGKFSSAVH